MDLVMLCCGVVLPTFVLPAQCCSSLLQHQACGMPLSVAHGTNISPHACRAVAPYMVYRQDQAQAVLDPDSGLVPHANMASLHRDPIPLKVTLGGRTLIFSSFVSRAGPRLGLMKLAWLAGIGARPHLSPVTSWRAAQVRSVVAKHGADCRTLHCPAARVRAQVRSASQQGGHGKCICAAPAGQEEKRPAAVGAAVAEHCSCAAQQWGETGACPRRASCLFVHPSCCCAATSGPRMAEAQDRYDDAGWRPVPCHPHRSRGHHFPGTAATHDIHHPGALGPACMGAPGAPCCRPRRAMQQQFCVACIISRC